MVLLTRRVRVEWEKLGWVWMECTYLLVTISLVYRLPEAGENVDG